MAVGELLVSAVVVVVVVVETVVLIELTLDVWTGAPTVTLVRVVEIALDLVPMALLLALLADNKRAPQTLALYPGARALLFM